MNTCVAFIFLCMGVGCIAGEAQVARFKAVEIDRNIEIGYGVTTADVDGDGKPDIVLADKKQIVWYRNPKWEKFVIAENLTKLDNVCVAAADIDGDGKAEIAVGAEWNPSDTVNSGAVFYLIPPQDRTQKWEPVELPHEPTVHRMRWVQNGSGKFDLIVAPLNGRGNKDGQGAGVRILAYKMPADPRAPGRVAAAGPAPVPRPTAHSPLSPSLPPIVSTTTENSTKESTLQSRPGCSVKSRHAATCS